MNDRSFENRERTMGKIIFMFFETLSLRTAAYVYPQSISFSDFLVCFALSSKMVSLIYYMCT